MLEGYYERQKRRSRCRAGLFLCTDAVKHSTLDTCSGGSSDNFDTSDHLRTELLVRTAGIVGGSSLMKKTKKADAEKQRPQVYRVLRGMNPTTGVWC